MSATKTDHAKIEAVLNILKAANAEADKIDTNQPDAVFKIAVLTTYTLDRIEDEIGYED